mmetsp:Transcript_1607/g.4146  ORF Transcript_1607/g.4146 Transcript_1607/m.4146 type:complete len:583 (+) Transcript_1607:84-1832(+)
MMESLDPEVSEAQIDRVRERCHDVRVLVVKGNLRHRIQKLGIELPDDELTPQQRQLRQIANSIPDEHVGPITKFASKARPDWCGGGFAFLTLDHGEWVPQIVRAYGLQLQSKHIVVSSDFRDLLKDTLEETPVGAKGPGREAFLTRRAGVIAADEPLINLRDAPATCKPCDDMQVYKDDKEAPEGGASLSVQVPAIFKGAEDAEMPFKPFRFRKLPPDVAELDLDEALVEFVTAPVSLQELTQQQDPGMWEKVWEIVCEENRWLQMQRHWEVQDTEAPNGGCFPFCIYCEKWADMPHLLSKQCLAQRKAEGAQLGRLLTAILDTAERNDYVPISSHGEEKVSTSADVRSEGEAASEVSTDVALPIQRPKGWEFPASTARSSQAPPRFFGRCAAPDCPWPLGGRGSQSHCCFRCQESHKAGKPLKEDPRTGEPWRKRHGAECTSHVVPKGPLGAAAEAVQNQRHPQKGPPTWQCPYGCGVLIQSDREMQKHMKQVHGTQHQGRYSPEEGGRDADAWGMAPPHDQYSMMMQQQIPPPPQMQQYQQMPRHMQAQQMHAMPPHAAQYYGGNYGYPYYPPPPPPCHW